MIYLIDERDQENEDETAKEFEVQGIQGIIVRIKFVSAGNL